MLDHHQSLSGFRKSSCKRAKDPAGGLKYMSRFVSDGYNLKALVQFGSRVDSDRAECVQLDFREGTRWLRGRTVVQFV